MDLLDDDSISSNSNLEYEKADYLRQARNFFLIGVAIGIFPAGVMATYSPNGFERAFGLASGSAELIVFSVLGIAVLVGCLALYWLGRWARIRFFM